MTFLVDTNVVSELRKGTRCDEGVRRWFEAVSDDAIFLSVLTVGELRVRERIAVRAAVPRLRVGRVRLDSRPASLLGSGGAESASRGRCAVGPAGANGRRNGQPPPRNASGGGRLAERERTHGVVGERVQQQDGSRLLQATYEEP